MTSSTLKATFWGIIVVTLLWVQCPALRAQALDQAAFSAVAQLRDRGLAQHEKDELIIEVVNYHSQRYDRESRLIESALFSALCSFRQPKVDDIS